MTHFPIPLALWWNTSMPWKGRLKNHLNSKIVSLDSWGTSFILPRAPISSQLVALASHPVLFSSHPVVPSSQLVLFCGFLFLFAKSNVFLNQIKDDKQFSEYSLVPVINNVQRFPSSGLQDVVSFLFLPLVILFYMLQFLSFIWSLKKITQTSC